VKENITIKYVDKANEVAESVAYEYNEDVCNGFSERVMSIFVKLNTSQLANRYRNFYFCVIVGSQSDKDF
jgi:hypothetical protein